MLCKATSVLCLLTETRVANRHHASIFPGKCRRKADATICGGYSVHQELVTFSQMSSKSVFECTLFFQNAMTQIWSCLSGDPSE